MPEVSESKSWPLYESIDYSSVELTRTNAESEEFTAAALLQRIREIVNANKDDNVEGATNSSNPFASSPFQRTVNWTFENMKMLIGSDLPIFGDEQHPAVSLRLR